MGKCTFIYNTGKLRVFCDMETKELFYRRNTDEKAPVIVGGSMACSSAAGEVVQTLFKIDLAIGVKLLLFGISNLIVFLVYFLAKRNYKKYFHTYYPAKLEFTDGLPKIRKAYRNSVIAAVILALLTVAFTLWYMKSGGFMPLIFEWMTALLLVDSMFYSGLFRRKKAIKMIENREIP